VGADFQNARSGLKRNGVWELMQLTFSHDAMKCSTVSVLMFIVSCTLLLHTLSLLTSLVLLHSHLLTVFSCCIYGFNQIHDAVPYTSFLSITLDGIHHVALR